MNLEDKLTPHLYVDTSSVEIFVSDGVRTFTECSYVNKWHIFF
ncbi:GH32 C-terminal domain-containing protein [Loigolactobacillus coryniformis]